MGTSNHGDASAAILPAPACDLLDRFTSELDLRLSLTDLHGAVVASTGGLTAGSVDPMAAEIAALRSRPPGLAPEQGVYLPVRLSGRLAGILIVHSTEPRAAVAAPVVAIALGLALDFAEAASSVGGARMDPGWVLGALMRGARPAARRARVASSIIGWNLFAQRVALVVLIPPADLRRHPGSATAPVTVIERVLGPDAALTPFGQLDEAEWLILARYDRGDSWSTITRLATVVHDALAAAGLPASVGIGEPHLPQSRTASLRRSYRDALYAARLGPRLSGSGGVFELRALGPAAFFAPGSPSRRNLAAAVLAPLRAYPTALETLRTYLACDMSLADTALRLELHRHTVRNHLDRIATLTGLEPRSLEGAVQLKLALLVAESEPSVLGLHPEDDR